MGSSPFQLLQPCFFFLLFFIICSTHYKITKFFIFFISSLEPNKFIIVYFILFFPVLHSVKPQEKNFLNTFFFSFNSGLFCPKFLKLLRFYFLSLVFNIFPMCYSPSTQFHITHTTHHVIHPSTHKTQCIQCSNPVS